MSIMTPWEASHDGDFAEAFIKRCLTPIEMGELLKQPLPQSTGGPYSRDENDAFKLESDTRKTLVDIVLTWTDIYAGGVILSSTNDQTKLFLVFEFISQHKRDFDEREDSMNTTCIEPLLFVEYATSPTMKQAELLLRDEDVDLITCSDEVLFRLHRLFQESFPEVGLIDVVSSLIVREGYIEPIRPPSALPSPPPSPLVGGPTHVKNAEEKEEYEDDEEDEYNDSLEFEDEINAMSDFGSNIHDSEIKLEPKIDKKTRETWTSNFFIVSISFIIIAILHQFHEEDMIQNVFSASEETFHFFDEELMKIGLLSKGFSLDFVDSTVTKLVSGLYNFTTNHALVLV